MSFCEYFDRSQCRSCAWLDQDYTTQLEAKERRIRESLGFMTWAGSLAPAVGSRGTAPGPQGFRDRAKLAVTGTVEAPVVGLVGPPTELDRGQELTGCPIHHPWLQGLLSALPAWITAQGLEPYRIEARRGELKGVIAFYSPETQQGYMRLVLRSGAAIPRVEAGIPALQSRFPELVCVSANIQPIPHAYLEGPEEILLTPRTSIDHGLGSLRLQLAPQAFVQTNSEVATQLYRTAAGWVRESGVARMSELFCGQGAFSFFAAQEEGGVREILGVEQTAEAVSAAQRTALALGLAGLRFECADANRSAELIASWQPELVLVNPPRRGLGKEGVEVIRRVRPRHLLYSSCAIETLAADLGALQADYSTIRRARLFDLFPHTEHFETLVWLERTS